MPMTASKINKQSRSTNMVLRFPSGLIGFGEYKDFALLYPGKGEVACLQSMNEPSLSLLVAEWDDKRLGAKPEYVGNDLEVPVPMADEEMIWLLVLNPSGDSNWITANAQAPILIGIQSRIGRQIVLDHEKYSIRVPWIRKKSAPPPAGEWK